MINFKIVILSNRQPKCTKKQIIEGSKTTEGFAAFAPSQGSKPWGNKLANYHVVLCVCVCFEQSKILSCIFEKKTQCQPILETFWQKTCHFAGAWWGVVIQQIIKHTRLNRILATHKRARRERGRERERNKNQANQAIFGPVGISKINTWNILL